MCLCGGVPHGGISFDGWVGGFKTKHGIGGIPHAPLHYGNPGVCATGGAFLGVLYFLELHYPAGLLGRDWFMS